MELKKFAKAAAVAAVMAVSSAPASAVNPYSDCGIGAAIFTETHWAAAISNVIWDLGSTAITSATASPETCSGADVETAMFINDTYETLVEETARGEGAHLSTVLSMAGCSASEQAQAATLVRSGMADVIAADGYATAPQIEKSSAFYTVVEGSTIASCSGADA